MSFSQNQNPTFPFQPQASRVNIANADGQTLKTAYTAGANGSKITGIIASSTDTSPRDITVYITNSTNYPLGTTTVAAASGTAAGTPAVNLMATTVVVGMPKDSDGNPFIYLISGDTLTVEALTTVTAAKAITVHVFGTDF